MGNEMDDSFGEWLRREMAAHGYDPGERAGGRSRLAKDAGVSFTTISRCLNEGRVPKLEGLRSLGRVLGHTLGEMMVHAGLADVDEMTITIRQDSEPPQEGADPDEPYRGWPADLASHVDPTALPPVQYQVLRYVTALPPEDRIMLSEYAQVMVVQRRRRETQGTPASTDESPRRNIS